MAPTSMMRPHTPACAAVETPTAIVRRHDEESASLPGVLDHAQGGGGLDHCKRRWARILTRGQCGTRRGHRHTAALERQSKAAPTVRAGRRGGNFARATALPTGREGANRA